MEALVLQQPTNLLDLPQLSFSFAEAMRKGKVRVKDHAGLA
jgi:hypothetical protein